MQTGRITSPTVPKAPEKGSPDAADEAPLIKVRATVTNPPAKKRIPRTTNIIPFRLVPTTPNRPPVVRLASSLAKTVPPTDQSSGTATQSPSLTTPQKDSPRISTGTGGSRLPASS